jgi:DNA-binding transcriptional regulator YiaG
MRQPQLAGLAGVGLNTVKRFEAGAVLRNAQAEAIVRALRSTEFP